MNIFESITSAAYSVLANRMRSILTMLGIIIGIAAVIMITSIGQGFQNSINDMFADIGAGTLEIQVRHNMTDPATRSDMLTMDSVAFLATHPDVSSVTPISTASARVQRRNPTETSQVNVFGTTENFRDVQNLDIRFGRFLTEMDVERAAPVAIIDSRLARQVFGRTDVIGETIRATFWFGSVELLVIGIYRSDDFDFGFEMPTTLLMPITYLQRLMNTDNVVDLIFANAQDLERLEQTAEEISRLLSLKHGNEDRYRVTALMSQIDMINDMIGMVTGFVGLVAFISLAVGGIGVMNIM
ncbi:MAG: ABC transporter permease, partial [Defluviitaleaceae bacterium]|nr:ABC transporter permease [Defluviitaleaceae bacterium]